MAAEIHDLVAARLLGIGQRYTSGRRELVEILAGSGRPLTTPEILADRRSLPQSTVYRNLAVLEAAAAVHRVAGADGFSRYELAEGLTEHHHHLVCSGCGLVSDHTPSRRLERWMERAMEEVAAGTGFRPDSHRLDLVGLCPGCQAGRR